MYYLALPGRILPVGGSGQGAQALSEKVVPEQLVDNMATDLKVPVLEGKEAEEFLQYMSRPLSNEEKESLRDAYQFYKKHSKTPA